MPDIIEELLAAIEADPDDAETRYELALAHEERGDHDGMVREFLQVRLIDAANDRHDGVGTPAQIALIEQVATEVLERLPEPFASRLAGVPVVLEPRPTTALVRTGFDPRALGLFEGAMMAEAFDVVEAPTRIVLYTHNLLATFHDEDELCEQVEITVLHEVGHYFGLDEDDMERLDLH